MKNIGLQLNKCGVKSMSKFEAIQSIWLINLIAISDGQSEVRSEEKMKRINYDAKTREF